MDQKCATQVKFLPVVIKVVLGFPELRHAMQYCKLIFIKYRGLKNHY